jgi:hypothetical protein
MRTILLKNARRLVFFFLVGIQTKRAEKRGAPGSNCLAATPELWWKRHLGGSDFGSLLRAATE